MSSRRIAWYCAGFEIRCPRDSGVQISPTAPMTCFEHTKGRVLKLNQTYRPMRGVLLAVCLLSTMTLAGCLGPSTAAWGTGSGAVNVDYSMAQDGTTVQSTLSGTSTTVGDLTTVGCTPGTEGGTLAAGNGSTMTFSGYLSASRLYDAHNEQNGARGLDFAVTAAAAIEAMPFEQARSVEEGDGSRIVAKSWDAPLLPTTSGSAELHAMDQESESSWFVLGMIPATEHILYGMTALDEWHQPITVEGYLVTSNATQTGMWTSKAYSVKNDCSIGVGNSKLESLYVLVTGFTFETSSVSLDGNADDEWVQGDIPVVGRSLFILLFLVAGIGGFVGTYIASTKMLTRSANRTMEILVGSEGMEKASKVRSDASAAREAGMESPSERKARQDRTRREQEVVTTPPKRKKESAKAKEDEDAGDALGGFDLDSVLASTGSTSSSRGKSGPSGRSSSVVVTDAAANMDRMQASSPSTSEPAPARAGGPPRSRSPPTRSPPNISSQATEETTAPVRRRRIAKKPKPEEPTEQSSAPSYHDEEEEFSDFSF